jgi:DNA-directed RNA polymerase subunit RPC12/RpoP
VIKFKCIYCGQRILAQDEGRGKKGHCPKCRHELRVPITTKGRPAISADIPEKLQQAREAFALRNIATAGPQSQDDLAELWGEKAGWFIPIYDELSLFLMAATLILLYATNPPMREQIYKWIASKDAHIFFWFLVFMGGLCLSICHVFTTKKKTDIEKWVMLIFAVLANAGTGIIAGIYVIKNSAVRNWLLVFPIWNIINGVLLLLMLRFRIIDEECISDRKATLVQIILGLIAVLAIFIFCNYVFKLYWAITFSICIVYTTSFDSALQSVFPGLEYGEDERA